MMASISTPRVLALKPQGLLDQNGSHDHFAALADQLVRQRQTFGKARVLVDCTNMIVQPQVTAGRIQAGIVGAYRPEDEVAYVGLSALLQMQLKRIGSPAEVRTFDDVAGAMSWLSRS